MNVVRVSVLNTETTRWYTLPLLILLVNFVYMIWPASQRHIGSTFRTSTARALDMNALQLLKKWKKTEAQLSSAWHNWLLFQVFLSLSGEVKYTKGPLAAKKTAAVWRKGTL